MRLVANSGRGGTGPRPLSILGGTTGPLPLNVHLPQHSGRAYWAPPTQCPSPSALWEGILGPSHSVPILLSILGMHLFGCKFSLKTDSGDTVPDRKNFDSLLWAIVTVFQVQPQLSRGQPKALSPGRRKGLLVGPDPPSALQTCPSRS